MCAFFPRKSGARAGFTLLEVLVVIALIGLLTGVLVVGSSRLLGDRPKSPAELFWSAVSQARKTALQQNRSVRLSLDSATQEFLAVMDGAASVRLPFVPKETAELDFLPPKSPSGASSILIAGDLVETQTLAAVTFYGDGTCAPFRAQLKTRNQVHILEIDPWTCAPLLTEEVPR
jgi:prepilin-type N-terminal cleavage/methylation domain-containing protein